MRKLFFLLLFLSLYTQGFNKTFPNKIVEGELSKTLNEISYYWKSDSLGKNGYRLCMSSKLFKAKIDSRITIEFLVSKLGEPNFIGKSNSGTLNYHYYYFDGRSIPENEGYSKELLYIVFHFNNSSFLTKIFNGAVDD